MELGGRIREYRTEKSWSQEELAERCYVSRQTVSNWENEKSYPDVHSLLILGDLFGVSLDELIKGDVDTMKETVRNEDAARMKRLQWMVLGEFAALFACTLLVDKGGEFGVALGALLAGALAVGIFLTFRQFEQLKQTNDIQTYRELLAFMNGQTLDELEAEKEQQKRQSQKKLLIFVVVQAALILIAGAVSIFLQLQ